MKKTFILISLVTFILVTNQLFAQNPPTTDGLVAYYPFNGNANDESSNSYNGTVSGATLATDRFGQTDSAFSFDGSNDYIAIPNTPINGLSAVTISLWMKTTSAATNYDAVFWSRGTTYNWIGFAIPSPGSVKFYIANGTTSVNKTTSFPLGSWVHVVATWSSGSGCKLYINNTPTSESAALSGTISLNDNIKIGRDDYQGTRHFPGIVDDIRLYNRVLSISEIEDLYNETPNPDPTPVTYYWKKNAENIYYNNGNVGIGTTNPQSLLAVNGIITAKEVLITETGWADFVFEPNYALPSLEAVENYINTHKHLPDVPSEKEVNEDGVTLGKNNAVLLQKIEELTLYAIEQNKKLKDKSKKIEELEESIKKVYKDAEIEALKKAKVENEVKVEKLEEMLKVQQNAIEQLKEEINEIKN
jgi:hypothetical protein